MIRQLIDRSAHKQVRLTPLDHSGRVQIGQRHVKSVLKRHGWNMLAARQPVTLLKDNPPEPARKSRRFMQFCQVEIRLQKGLLRSIFGQLSVAEHRVRTGIRHILKPPNNLIEGP